jgi:RNA polymerase sigma-70 factor (sigma-E family)
MVSLVASGRGRRRRMFVAALFAYTESAVVSEPFPTHAHSQARADELVIRMFTQEAPSLVRLARLFTDDRNAAEDLVQEAFIRLHRSANRIEHADRAAPYLRSIVLNLARDHNRRGLMSLRHRVATMPDDGGELLEDQIVRTEDQSKVVAALRELSARQRDCLVLKYFYDLKGSEIAETLGISPNSVKTHCRRGLAALEARLGDVT